jgi:hypothetical protein
MMLTALSSRVPATQRTRPGKTVESSATQAGVPMSEGRAPAAVGRGSERDRPDCGHPPARGTGKAANVRGPAVADPGAARVGERLRVAGARYVRIHGLRLKRGEAERNGKIDFFPAEYRAEDALAEERSRARAAGRAERGEKAQRDAARGAAERPADHDRSRPRRAVEKG